MTVGDEEELRNADEHTELTIQAKKAGPSGLFGMMWTEIFPR